MGMCLYVYLHPYWQQRVLKPCWSWSYHNSAVWQSQKQTILCIIGVGCYIHKFGEPISFGILGDAISLRWVLTHIMLNIILCIKKTCIFATLKIYNYCIQALAFWKNVVLNMWCRLGWLTISLLFKLGLFVSILFYLILSFSLLCKLGFFVSFLIGLVFFS